MSRILIAEDEERIATFVQSGLESNGFTTTVVADGQSAYETASLQDHDLIILDLGLPQMDGMTVLRRLREERGAVPVLILTARHSVTDTDAGLAGVCDDYLDTPLPFAGLIA